MPRLCRLFIKTSLFYFFLTFLAGAVFIALKVFFSIQVPSSFVTVHIHMGAVGWIAMMIMGVAYWMFPLSRDKYSAGKGRYREKEVQTVFLLVQGGLIARIVAEPIYSAYGYGAAGVLLALSGFAQATGAALFIYSIWTRIRTVPGMID